LWDCVADWCKGSRSQSGNHPKLWLICLTSIQQWWLYSKMRFAVPFSLSFCALGRSMTVRSFGYFGWLTAFLKNRNPQIIRFWVNFPIHRCGQWMPEIWGSSGPTFINPGFCLIFPFPKVLCNATLPSSLNRSRSKIMDRQNPPRMPRILDPPPPVAIDWGASANRIRP
jgi:hypothetical protein